MESPVNNSQNNTLSTLTILLIFIMAAINQIFLISLIVVLIKKIKLIVRSLARKYYLFILFYVVSKMGLCIFLEFKILQGLPNNFQNVESQDIEHIFKNTLAFADCSVIQLFMISFQYYLTISFSILGNQKVQKVVRILVQSVQILTFLTLMIPLLMFNLGLVNYDLLNTFMCALNCMTVAAFLASFFFMNFKMTGIMLDKKTSQIIKKIYKLLLVVLLSRVIMATIEIMVEINISNGNFEDYITIIQKNQGQFVTLGFCFILYVLLIMLTEGLPLALSLRQSLLLAFDSSQNIRKDSLISSQDINQDAIRQDLLTNFQQQETGDYEQTYRRSIENRPLQDINELEELQKISQTSYFKSFKGRFDGCKYYIKQIGNISSYIIEQINKQIDFLTKNDLRCINRIKVLHKNDKLYIVEKFMHQNLDNKIDQLNSNSGKIRVCLKLAQAIKKLHDKNYAHGSINPNNVMFDQNDQVVLTGYGLQSLRKYLSLTSQYTNISMYTAVQLLGTKRQKTISKPHNKADIYSFGIIFYEIFSQNRKYRDLNIQDIRMKFLKQNSRPKIPDYVPQPLKKIMRKCWQQNPENRPQISWIIDFIQSIKDSI